MISGTLGSTPITGKLRGTEITFTAGDAQYTGQVNGNTMQGTVKGGKGGSWTRDEAMYASERDGAVRRGRRTRASRCGPSPSRLP